MGKPAQRLRATMTAKGVITDAAGNSYVTGSFAGTTSFGRLALTSRGLTDLFLVKYNPAGKALWATQIGRDPKTPSYSQPTASGADVALDAAGNVYVIGNFTGTLSYGSNSTISSFSNGFNTALVAKFNSGGQVQWVERFGIPQFGCYGYAIATDAAGNSYVTGQSDYGGIQFGPQVVGGSRRVMYVARYNATGSVAWAKVSSNCSSYGASGADVALDGRGNCVVGGGFINDMTLDGTALTAAGYDAFLASFHAASGSLQWIRQGGGGSASSNAYISAVATDAQGNVYAAGQHSGLASFGGSPYQTMATPTSFWPAIPARGRCSGCIPVARARRSTAPAWSQLPKATAP
ncbi:SBBP repeat-containing protein [Hymenobacter sp. 5516J-16]|uniref:SBBP repeat-containing protein n=1 Tax=Hymenobacter sp. 5516J-16 TaxID=2932253 RepID=UPI001FD5D2E9|nr:SBBP repeat-containing protein [Hymenobacter sp. 5516J-16]UOQ78661.1 SBBP repeat-containing protein [Hymenobacter sp. 5516J-16]